MKNDVVAKNVKRFRAVRKISQQKLADKAGLSVLAIKNIEHVKGEPRMSTLEAVTKALNVKLLDLFKSVRVLHAVRFRSKKKIRNRENILAEVVLWLDDFNYLEEELDCRIPFKLVGILKNEK